MNALTKAAKPQGLENVLIVVVSALSLAVLMSYYI